MPKRFLLVQLADIGDLILTTPAISALREAYPDAHLTLLTTPHARTILPENLVNEVIAFDKRYIYPQALLKPDGLRAWKNLIGKIRQGHYDTAIFFHHFTLTLGIWKFALLAYLGGIPKRIGLQNGKGFFLTNSIPDEGFGAKHQAQYWLALVGLLGADMSDRPASITQQVFDMPKSEKPRVVIHAGSGGYSLARRWLPRRFAQVADALVEEFQAEIVIVGTKEDDGQQVLEAMHYPATNLISKTSLAQLASVLQSADLFIGAESGVMHLAASVGVPMISIFGPGNHQAWVPWVNHPHVSIVRTAPECSPCSYVGHSLGLREGCPARTCIQMITSEQVLVEAKRLLGGVEGAQFIAPLQTEPSAVPFSRIHILNIPVDAITYEQWLEWIRDKITNGNRCYHVCTTNPEFVMIAQEDVLFRLILQRADLCIPDGVGLLWASRYLGKPLPQRVTGSDGVPWIAQHASKYGWKLFFLGAGEGIAEKAANTLCEKYPQLQVVGVYAGSPAPEEEEAIVNMVNASGADILFVGYGAPNQDKWIARNLPRLQVKMAMGVGGSFDFIAGIIPRAPQWMQKAGLEWLYRLYLQPWRFKRMMRLPRFVLAVLWHGRGKEG